MHTSHKSLNFVFAFITSHLSIKTLSFLKFWCILIHIYISRYTPVVTVLVPALCNKMPFCKKKIKKKKNIYIYM